MPREINLPQWGMAMNDGTVVKWLKKISINQFLKTLLS